MEASRKHPTYIWQRSQWPNFHWDSDALIAPLSRLCSHHGLLQGRLSLLGLRERNNAQLGAMTDELTASSCIEGVSLNASSVRSSIVRRLGIEGEELHPEDYYVEGLVEVMLDATRNCHAPLSDDRLFGWHSALFPTGRSGMTKIAVGRWREGEEPLQVFSGAYGHEHVHFEAPPSAEVPFLMQALMDWCNTSSHPAYITAAVAHLWFMTIHPFDDGNGRIGRTLSDMLLSRIDNGAEKIYSVSAEINRNKREYYDALEQAQHGGLDVTAWVVWFLGCVDRAVLSSLSSLDSTMAKARFWERFRDVDINERQRKALNRLLDGFTGNLTTMRWARMCHCSQDTALRDIRDLIDKGMLLRGDASGRSAHYSLVAGRGSND